MNSRNWVGQFKQYTKLLSFYCLVYRGRYLYWNCESKCCCQFLFIEMYLISFGSIQKISVFMFIVENWIIKWLVNIDKNISSVIEILVLNFCREKWTDYNSSCCNPCEVKNFINFQGKINKMLERLGKLKLYIDTFRLIEIEFKQCTPICP